MHHGAGVRGDIDSLDARGLVYAIKIGLVEFSNIR